MGWLKEKLIGLYCYRLWGCFLDLLEVSKRVLCLYFYSRFRYHLQINLKLRFIFPLSRLRFTWISILFLTFLCLFYMITINIFQATWNIIINSKSGLQLVPVEIVQQKYVPNSGWFLVKNLDQTLNWVWVEA